MSDKTPLHMKPIPQFMRLKTAPSTDDDPLETDPYDQMNNTATSESTISFVAKQLQEKAALFEKKNKEYGDAYEHFGYIALELFGNATISNSRDWSRVMLVAVMLGKLQRYVANFNKGGHDDSLDDIAVYAMMLKHLDFIAKQ